MELSSPPYALRLLALLVLAVSLVVWESLRRPGRFTRWREYAFLAGCGLAGCVLGVLNDQITSSLSPEYFVLGKEIPAGEEFRLRVASLGAKAGSSAGIIAGAFYLFANTFRSPRPIVSYRRLTILTWKPIASAIVLGVAGALLFPRVCPRGLINDLETVLTASETASFVTVWGAHIGVYVGAAVGVLWGVCGIRRETPRE